MEPLVVSVQLTAEDLVQARKLDRLRRTWMGRHAGALLIMLSLGLTVVFIFIYGLEFFHFAIFTAIALLGLTVLVDRVWVTAGARRAYRNDPGFNRPFTIEISEFGVQQSGYAAQGSRRWAEIPRWTQGELLYLIYAPDGTYSVVPKRFMPDATALAEVLREKLGPAV